MLRHVSLVLVFGAAVLACEREYVYRPAVTTTSSATISGLPASYEPIPPEAPRGHVRIAMMGFADIVPEGASRAELRALEVRMIIANNSDRAWSLDTRDQIATLPNGDERRPAYVTVANSVPPAITIAPRSEKTLELFYPLPDRMQKESQMPSFDVVWQVDTDGRRVVQRTPFERSQIVAAETSYPPSAAQGFEGPYPGSYVVGEPFYDTYYTYGGRSVQGPAPAFEKRPVSIRRHTVQVIPGPR
jgi:hypothetical protein